MTEIESASPEELETFLYQTSPVICSPILHNFPEHVFSSLTASSPAVFSSSICTDDGYTRAQVHAPSAPPMSIANDSVTLRNDIVTPTALRVFAQHDTVNNRVCLTFGQSQSNRGSLCCGDPDLPRSPGHSRSADEMRDVDLCAPYDEIVEDPRFHRMRLRASTHIQRRLNVDTTTPLCRK